MEWDILSHIILTSERDWDTSVIYSNKSEDDVWFDTISDS